MYYYDFNSKFIIKAAQFALNLSLLSFSNVNYVLRHKSFQTLHDFLVCVGIIK